MPGITGIFRRGAHDAEKAERDLAQMVAAMQHEPYYVHGRFVNRDLGIYLGWCGHGRMMPKMQPLVRQSGDRVLVFYGEHFGENDLVELFESDDFLPQLNGWFAGVVVNLREKTATLFNDRTGMGRVYVHDAPEEMLFGSEAKCLLKVRPALREIDPESLAQYLRTNCVMADKSLFKNIALLPSASAWTIQKKRCYFDFREWEEQPTLPPNEFYEEFAATINEVVPNYAREGDEVALSLTAGLDTRVIMVALQRQPRSFPCYTFGGAWGETFDIRTARKLAAAAHQPYQTFKIGEEFLRAFGPYAERCAYLSEGTHDAFGAHDVYFNEIAREVAPIRLTGKLGSEIVRVRKVIPFDKFPENAVTPQIRELLPKVQSLEEASGIAHPLTRVVRQALHWYEHGRIAVEQSQLTLRSPYTDNALLKLMFQMSYAERLAGEVQARYTKETNPVLDSLPTNMGQMGGRSVLASQVLYAVFWGLFKIEYTYLYATPHWLARVDRSFAALHLERLLSGREKFEGYRIWLKTHFAEFVRAKLLNPNASYTRYFDYATISKMVKCHTAGTHSYLNEINKALTIELVCDSLLK